MSFQQKKNLLDKLILDDNFDLDLEPEQQLVMYLAPAGVNIHRVIPLELCPDLQHTTNNNNKSTEELPSNNSSDFLVSMPKKYRGLQYLKKCDLMIIDSIPEGKKVIGEISCIISKAHVLSLFQRKQWPSSTFLDSLGSSSSSLSSDWHAKFNSIFNGTTASSSSSKKNSNGCEMQEDFVSSSDDCSSSEHEEEEEDCDEDDEEAEEEAFPDRNSLTSVAAAQPINNQIPPRPVTSGASV